MQIIPEIDVKDNLRRDIEKLRNRCFPELSNIPKNYKQLPHYRALKFMGNDLSVYMALDYRAISIEGSPYNVLIVIDFCIAPEFSGVGVGSRMLNDLVRYAEGKSIDFVLLITDEFEFYGCEDFKHCKSTASWLKIHQNKNCGVAVEEIEGLYVKQVGSKQWRSGHIDWLGYMF